MKFIVLDDFPLWTTYLLGLIVLCGFVFVLTMLIRSLSIAGRDSAGSRTRPRRRHPPWFFVVCGAAALWFLGSSMYLRFHAVGLGAKEIDLIFFWPRAPVRLEAGDLLDVRLLRRQRGCGHLEVVTRQELYRSVNFRNCYGAEEILRTIVPNRGANS
jgi:hypothetical protein